MLPAHFHSDLVLATGGRSEPPPTSLPLLRGSWHGRSLCFLLSKGETTTHPSDNLRRLNLIYGVHGTLYIASVQQMLIPLPFCLFRKLSRSQPQSSTLFRGNILSFFKILSFVLVWLFFFFCQCYLYMMTLGTEYETFLHPSNTYFFQQIYFSALICVTQKLDERNDAPD